MCGSCCLPTQIFFNPTLNIKMVFGDKVPKMGTFSDFVTLNVITKFKNFPTYPKFCWYATGTPHIFHLGLIKKDQMKANCFMQYTFSCCFLVYVIFVC